MKPHVNSVALVVAAMFSLQAFAADEQATASRKPNKAAEFAANQQAMQDLSRSSASGPMAMPPTPGGAMNRNNDAGKGAFEGEMMLQRNKPSPKVDRNAKASDPIKSISKMTMQERAQLRQEVVKEAKP
jgi:hypothetical protein